MDTREVTRLMGSPLVRDAEQPHAALAAALATRWSSDREALWRVRMALWRLRMALWRLRWLSRRGGSDGEAV